MIFNIVHGTNKARGRSISVTETINFYPEKEDAEKSKYVSALIGCPGTRLAATAHTSGKCRYLYATSTERMFAVVSNRLIEIGTNETPTDRGTLSTSTGECRMCDNGSQVFIVDGTYGYIYDLSTNVLTLITDADFPSNPTNCIFTDGYFLATFADSGQFYFSASYDGTSWSALEFATAEYSADTLVGIAKTSNGTIWMIGKASLELWANVGVADLPWRRIEGSVKEKGCAAPYSIASDGDSVFWLGDGKNSYGAVFMGVGYDVVRISTIAVEHQILELTNIEQATGYVYSENGHRFYVINFTSEKTFVYDVTTGEWHVKATYNSLSGENIRHSGAYAAFFNGKNYLGSYTDAGIYEMSLNLLDEAGSTIQREVITNHISDENRLIRYFMVEMDLEKGVGLENEDAPKVMMQYSNDGGASYSSINYGADAGAIGEFSRRTLWRRVGKGRDRVFKFTMSAPVKWIVNRLFIKAQ